MKLTKYQQSCFLIEVGSKKILIDPGNLVSIEVIESFVDVDILLFTHIHNDHCFIEYVDALLKNNPNIKIYGNDEVGEKLKDFGVNVVDEGDVINQGLIIEVVGGVHGYFFAMGDKSLPKVNGFIVRDQKTSVYHCGDTIAFPNARYHAHFVLAPVCGHSVVMEPGIAIDFCQNMGAKVMVPMHYDSEVHPKGTEQFERLAKERNVNYKILQVGESLVV